MSNSNEFMNGNPGEPVSDIPNLEVDARPSARETGLPQFTQEQRADLYAHRAAVSEAYYIRLAERAGRIPTADAVTEIDILFAKPMKLLTEEEFGQKTWWVERWLSQDAGAM